MILPHSGIQKMELKIKSTHDCFLVCPPSSFHFNMVSSNYLLAHLLHICTKLAHVLWNILPQEGRSTSPIWPSRRALNLILLVGLGTQWGGSLVIEKVPPPFCLTPWFFTLYLTFGILNYFDNFYIFYCIVRHTESLWITRWVAYKFTDVSYIEI